MSAQAVTTQLISMLDPQQESNDHSDLDGMILAHENEQEQNQDEEAVPSTEREDVVPSDLPSNEVVLLDYALAMVDQLINQAAFNRHARITAFSARDQPLPPATPVPDHASPDTNSVSEVVPSPTLPPIKENQHSTLTLPGLRSGF